MQIRAEKIRHRKVERIKKLLNMTDVFCKENVSLYIFKGNINVGMYLFTPGCRWENKTLQITDFIGG